MVRFYSFRKVSKIFFHFFFLPLQLLNHQYMMVSNNVHLNRMFFYFSLKRVFIGRHVFDAFLQKASKTLFFVRNRFQRSILSSDLLLRLFYIKKIRTKIGRFRPKFLISQNDENRFFSRKRSKMTIFWVFLWLFHFDEPQTGQH